MSIRFSAILAALSAILLLALPPVRAEDGAEGYRLGRGYPVGDTGIRLGGYADARVQAPRSGSWNFAVSDLSLFVTWEDGGRWRFFSETEVGDAVAAGEHQDLSTRNAHFELERLYVDHLFNDTLSVRFGKFLTPVGRWNLIHADPLVWTTTRPLATENPFSKNATGLMLHGGLPLADRRVDYAVYADLTSALDPHRSDQPFDNALGAHLLYAVADNLEVGLSYANFQLNDDPRHRHNLVGIEGFWSYRRYEASSEWVYRTGGSKDLWQGFVQGAAPLAAGWFAVGRYEFFEQEQGPAGQLGVFGLAFRPIPPLVWKVEYRLGTHNEAAAPDGLFGSFAVLF
jgi:hypothetical protein